MQIYFYGDWTEFKEYDKKYIIERLLKSRYTPRLRLVDGCFTRDISYWVGPIDFSKLEYDDNSIMKAFKNPRFSKWKINVSDVDFDTGSEKILHCSNFSIPMKRYTPYIN